MFVETFKNKVMAVRNSTARTSTNTVSVTINGIYITLMQKDWTVGKQYLYSIKKRILSGKIQIPSIEEKTGIAPYLLGYCHKETKNGVEFIWN